MIRALRQQKNDNLRPSSLEEYIGQDHIKDVLWTAMQAAQHRGQPLDHVLLNGPPGLGKTTLALIIASEMGWKIRTIIAPSLGSPRVAVQFLMMLPPQTMVFIDEIHRIRKPVQEVMYPALEDGKLFSPLNANVTLDFQPTTFIGATTNIGKLEQPFVDRFGLQFQLNYYNIDELSSIVMASSVRLRMPMVGWDVADEISKRARGTPRIANMFLKRIRDYADIDLKASITPDFVKKIIEKKLHTDELGLRPLDHRYLQLLSKATVPLGADTISTSLGEDVDTIQDFIEPYLLKIGFIERRSNGRWLTDDGKAHLRNTKFPG